MIVGTAGHIDHGKTSLVRALTGVDTDRLKEEKARGITIELGFAYWATPTGQTIGFIDVPGHERLVHTMLAGASGIDFVLLAIAADDGIMPQTREHVAIIDLLGISRGVVAMTKADLVTAARRADVASQIAELLGPTLMSSIDIVPVSTVTGEGIADLAARFDAAAVACANRAVEGRFRLAVDRTFSLAGAGTVVTGTALSGTVAVGDRVIVSPAGLEARVRSIHAQNRSVEKGVAGQRCALALVGAKVDKDSVHRGDVVMDPTLHAPVRRFDAEIKILPSERKAVGQWTPAKLHHGAAERDARIIVLGDRSISGGNSDFVQILVDEPISIAVGDRFVLRDISATRTIGGGTILDLRPPERHRRTAARRAELTALCDTNPIQSLQAILDSDRCFVDLDAFARDRAASASLADEAVAQLNLVVLDAGGARTGILPATWARFAEDAVAELDRFHLDKPDLPGLGQERLRLALRPRLSAPLFSEALAAMTRDGLVVLDRSWVRRPSHEVRLTPEEERIWAQVQPLLGGESRFRPPRVRDVAKLRSIDEALLRRLFKRAARRGDVDEIAQDHFFLAGAVVEMADIARALAAGADDGRFGVIEFRDRVDNGRKVAIQILEFFDRQGLTMRRGDVRRINPHKAELFSREHGAKLADARLRDGGVSSPVGRPDFKSGEGRETALGGFDSCLLRHSTQRDQRP